MAIVITEWNQSRPAPYSLVLQLQQALATEPRLSYRTRREIASLLRRGSLWGIEVDGRWSGFLLITPLSIRTVELHSLFIDPAYRGRGLARQLLRAALAQQPGRVFSVTWQHQVCELLQLEGYRIVAWRALSGFEMLNFLRQRLHWRRFLSIRAALRSAKPIYLLRQ